MARKKLDTLTEQMYYVLLALTEERHGYGIMQDTAALTGGRVIIGAGTLYALLSRFEADGLIRLSAERDNRKYYRLTEEGFRFLLPTAETALINLYRGEILSEDELPKKLFAYTPCYRREAGAYRASERGMIRGHQFNKVEMFGYTRPEDSDKMLKELIDKACRLVEGLGLHYRLSKLAAGDCSASMATTYDIELWIPSMNEYKECSSVSNARDYQARRGNIRFRRNETKKLEFVHTLNGSGLATSRLMPAIVEQFQQPDGSVVIPEKLRPWMDGMEKISPKR